MIYTIQELLRICKTKYIKDKSPPPSDIKAISHYIAFLFKEEKVNINLINNRVQSLYIRGLVHGFILAIIISIILKRIF